MVPPARPAGHDASASTRTMAFLVVDRFAMFALAAAIDIFRAANRQLGRDYYRWITLSPDGAPAAASSDLRLDVDCAMADLAARNTGETDILFVCAGMSLDFPAKDKVLAFLRKWGRGGGALGALSVGSHVLAEAGLLDGHRCAIHWENRAGFMELFPEVDCTGGVYEIDRKRYTSAGGVATLDLMLAIVRDDHGPALANAVANQFHYERVRSAGDRQRIGPERDLTGKSDKLRRVVELMADHLDEPLTSNDLAAAAGLSVRQVERLFLRHLTTTPGKYYVRLRLERARELLRQTNLSVLDIAVATGFASQSYFAQSYRLQFGRPPSEERRTAY